MTALATADALQTALDELVSGDWSTFDHLMTEPTPSALLTTTKTTVRCHYLASDPSGKPLVKQLAGQLAKQILRFCTPRSRLREIREMQDDEREEATTEAVLNARRLFTTKQATTGEGGELLLYALLERYLGIPQILSKMSLKTNTEMQVHGSDGIHAKIEHNGTLALYWGESKLMKNQSSAFAECFASTAPFLTQQSTAQDLLLIRTYADIGNFALRQALLDYFDSGKPQSAKLEMRAACLIGFPIEDYPVLPGDSRTIAKIDLELAKWRTEVSAKIAAFGLQSYTIEVFLVPLPSESEFRTAIREALNGG